MTFARFMELALGHPKLGYYSRVDRLLGPRGDFATAPALSPFFCRTLARLVSELAEAALEAEIVASGRVPAVVELGGGEGQLAQAVLAYWAKERPEWRGRIAYRIWEIAPGLRRRQQAVLAPFRRSGWQTGWGESLAEVCAQTAPLVMVGNEFLDALPVHLVRIENEAAQELYVGVEAQPAGRTLGLRWGPPCPEAQRELAFLFAPVAENAGNEDLLSSRPASWLAELARHTQDGLLELRPAVGNFLREAAALMPAGTLVTVDYGEWFAGVSGGAACPGVAESLRRRTLRGYFKHQLSLDLLARPGRQDLTADVDFAALDFHGSRCGFETVVFTTLSAFLRAGGAEQELATLDRAWQDASTDPLTADREATVLRTLLDEEALGRSFKLMLQVRDLAQT